MTYTRTNIYLTNRQLRLLRVLATTRETKVAELVRRAIDSFLGKRANRGS